MVLDFCDLSCVLPTVPLQISAGGVPIINMRFLLPPYVDAGLDYCVAIIFLIFERKLQ